MKKQPALSLSLTTSNDTVRYSNNFTFIDPVTTITASASEVIYLHSLFKMMMIDSENKTYQSPVAINNNESVSVRPVKTPSVKYTAVATNIDGIQTTKSISINVTQNKYGADDFTREIDPLTTTSTLDNGTTVESNITFSNDIYYTNVPYNSERLKIKLVLIYKKISKTIFYNGKILPILVQVDNQIMFGIMINGMYLMLILEYYCR